MPLESKSLRAGFLFFSKCQVRDSKVGSVPAPLEALLQSPLAWLHCSPHCPWANQLHSFHPSWWGSRCPSLALCPPCAWSSQTQAHTWYYDNMDFSFNQSCGLQLRPELAGTWATDFSQRLQIRGARAFAVTGQNLLSYSLKGGTRGGKRVLCRCAVISRGLPLTERRAVTFVSVDCLPGHSHSYWGLEDEVGEGKMERGAHVCCSALCQHYTQAH